VVLQAQRRAEAATSEAAAAKETAGHELALMRRQLAHAQSALVSAEKVCLPTSLCREFAWVSEQFMSLQLGTMQVQGGG
jgi:hypothetical protein